MSAMPPREKALILREWPPRSAWLYRERFSTLGLFENRVYPGIREALWRLKQSGATLFVATSKPTTFAERVIANGVKGIVHRAGTAAFVVLLAILAASGAAVPGARTRAGRGSPDC